MPVSRRALLGAGLAAAALTACGEQPQPVWTEPVTGPSGSDSPAGGPGSTPSASASASPGTTEKPDPNQPRYATRMAQTISRYLAPTPDNPRHPWYAGAVVLVSVDGKVQLQKAVGAALKYGVGPVELPPNRVVPMRTDAIFDLASITKVFTALLVLRLADQGRVDLSAPVAEYLPEFGKPAVRISMVLAHTSGLPVGVTLTGLTTRAARESAILSTPLIAGATPGTVFRYSGLGLMVLALMVERLTGKRLDVAVREHITGPLGMRDTGFRPLDRLSAAEVAARMVATDARPIRGLLRGVVHDGIANQLGGIAGHAGLFGTARDVAILGQALLGGGAYGGYRLLSEPMVERMLVNANPGLPAIDPDRPHRTASHGLGVELNQSWFMGRLAGPQTFGHTGFTGTSFLVDPRRRLVLVYLTSRAHPDWNWANPDPPRVAVANVLADAL